ncbi:putative quinol monooxygenase [Streptomyces sp. NPDC001663]|uniref:putative quinol monooxygenase n=1 Tax=Streptomyces sp. NPDC001663 TaxID=3364597 RepID=UPI0036C3C6CD
MSITLIADMKIKPGLLDEALSVIKDEMPEARAFEGCEYVNVYTAQDDPNRIVLIESWASEEAFASYDALRTERGDADAFTKYYDGAPSVTKLVATPGF